MRKPVIILWIIIFLNSWLAPVYPYSQALDFLCEIGIKFYQQGRYEDALHELRKALVVQPDYKPALDYIRMIEQERAARLPPIVAPPVIVRPKVEKAEVVPLPIPKPPVVPKIMPQVEKKERFVLPPVEAKKEAELKDKQEALAIEREERLKQEAELKAQKEAESKARQEELARQKEERIRQEEELKAIKQAGLKVKEEAKKIAAVPVGLPEVEEVREKIAPREILGLDESLSKIFQPIEIEEGKSITLLGKNIQRFLVTQPGILDVEKKSADELLLTGKNVGYTYLHIWDDKGRWTIEFLGTPLKPPGPTYEETLRREEEWQHNLKLTYSLTWSSFETGRRIRSLKRSNYSWGHSLGILGDTPTPYGKVNANATVRRAETTTDLTYLSLNLTEGQFGPFKGFTLRGFDYSLPFSNLAVSTSGLRGVMLNSPAFNEKLDYTVFWGREGGGRYGNLSPGLVKIKHSFLEGFNMDYSPTKEESYQFSLAHGWGRERPDYLTPYTYDITSAWDFDKWGLAYDIGFDSKTFAHRFNTVYSPNSNLNFTTELRNISKNFYNIAGKGWRAGELGALFNLNSKLTEKLSMGSRLDVFQDRLFSPPEKKDYWDETFDWAANYVVDPYTTLNSNYNLQNRLGSISKSRSQNMGLGVSKRIKFIRDISTYANYRHQDNENFSSPASSYINDKIYLGLRFNLIGALSYYFNQEFNWLEDTYTNTRSRPHSYETGLDWSSQLGQTPFYGNFRFTFRDEEGGGSGSSFLSGEDYIDGAVELSYRPDTNKEVYGACQMRNVWAENEETAKHIDFNFSAGLRYTWDTGFHFESVGNIEGYVFKDLNYDGLRQRDEAPVEGIKLWLGKKKSAVTDIFGYYKFSKVKAAKAYVTLDTSTLPAGFVLTVPATQEVAIVQKRSVEVDFGIMSRSEIGGFIFEDVNGNGEYDRNDKGVQGVIITLEDGSQAITDGSGRYSFAHVSTGEHTLTLDLDSLPVYYLPQTALTKKITLFEGVSYIHNIPLKRVQQ